ncbi:MAG: ribbon-helix-helix domain-containing protein [Candidatus Uhrbacteria bacterium]|nr:ribbon-helix-helix domain-containing protein [Candidatus Uhrbacteria bacterium]
MNKTFTISFNGDLANVVAKEMKRGKFENTSEFFRHLVRSQFLLDAYPIDAVDAKSSIAKASKRAARTEEFVSLSQARHDLSL